MLKIVGAITPRHPRSHWALSSSSSVSSSVCQWNTTLFFVCFVLLWMWWPCLLVGGRSGRSVESPDFVAFSRTDGRACDPATLHWHPVRNPGFRSVDPPPKKKKRKGERFTSTRSTRTLSLCLCELTRVWSRFCRVIIIAKCHTDAYRGHLFCKPCFRSHHYTFYKEVKSKDKVEKKHFWYFLWGFDFRVWLSAWYLLLLSVSLTFNNVQFCSGARLLFRRFSQFSRSWPIKTFLSLSCLVVITSI